MPNRKELEKAKRKEQEYQEEMARKAEEESWAQGVNKRSQKKDIQNREKQEEKMRLQKEKHDQMQEEEIYSNCQSRPKSRNGRKNKDLDLLHEALASAPKTKSQKEKEQKQKIKEANLFAQMKKEELTKERRQREERENYLLSKKGIVKQDDLMNSNIRLENRELFEEQSIYATGINDALDILNEKKATINYKEYYEKNLVVLKRETPGLRLSQYEEKIRKMWKVSFENPANQI